MGNDGNLPPAGDDKDSQNWHTKAEKAAKEKNPEGVPEKDKPNR